MATDNKRVAAYLPQDLYGHLEKFKAENKLTESKAIGSILAAHFGVAHEVSQKLAHQFVSVEQFTKLESKVAQLNESLSKLSKQAENKPKSEPKSMSQGELLSSISSDQFSVAIPQDLGPLKGPDLSKRFGLGKGTVAKIKSKYRDSPDLFVQWTRSKDQDGFGWEYREDTKLYHLIH